MLASTSISNLNRFKILFLIIAFSGITSYSTSSSVFADGGPGGPGPEQAGGGPQPDGGGGGGGGSKGDDAPVGKTKVPEEEDFGTENAFTSYAEFNESRDEEEDTRFFQYGRLFGASLGMGSEFATGNRGALWQGGFPLVDVKLHYWFNFNLAMDMGLFTSSQYYETQAASLGHVNVNILFLGVHIKYYFDTQNLSAPISFANPYILAGGGSYSKTESSVAAQYQSSDNSVGLALGGGLEFAVAPRKSYIEIEGKVHIVSFQDTYSTTFQSVGINDLTGLFLTLSMSIMLTW